MNKPEAGAAAGIDLRRSIHPETLGLGAQRGRLAGRRIVIVGAGQRKTVDEPPPVGNGRAISLLFAREGASLACIDIARDSVEETCSMIAAEGGRAFAEVADASDAAAIAPALERCASRLGGLDGLVMVVGMSTGLPLSGQTPEIWDKVFAVNVRSHMLFSQKALELMSPGSSIVLVSSLASQRAGGSNPSYESSKAAQIALARAVAKAGEPNGIRCNAIIPGYVDTPMGRDASRRRPGRKSARVPFGRQGTGWEVGYAALFLISNEASYINAQTLIVDGGQIADIAGS